MLRESNLIQWTSTQPERKNSRSSYKVAGRYPRSTTTTTTTTHTSVKEAARPGTIEAIVVSSNHVPRIAWEALHGQELHLPLRAIDASHIDLFGDCPKAIVDAWTT